MEASGPLGYGGGSPAADPGDFKDEDPKEKPAEAPPAEGREKAAAGAAGRDGGTETGAAAAASGFCGTGEVGVVGTLPDDRGWRSPSNGSGSAILMRDLAPGFWLIM